ncbi:MAG: type II toxin-antitoxin system VapB family antitoxin [Wenzhouxiangellaceae bacterium]|nr:type II toxin-antitoxin system VapB family antitoxin [Wenzhouxiangellaceae bacterium]
MRSTLNIDDELLTGARRVSGVSGQAALVRDRWRALIERESARRPAPGQGSSLSNLTRICC